MGGKWSGDLEAPALHDLDKPAVKHAVPGLGDRRGALPPRSDEAGARANVFESGQLETNPRSLYELDPVVGGRGPT